jgi:glucose/arabinose dehydrogenase
MIKHVTKLTMTGLLVVAAILPAVVSSASQPAPTSSTTATLVTISTTMSVTKPSSPLKGLKLEPIATGLNGPVEVLAPQPDGRVYIVERIGTVRIAQGGKLAKQPFANLRAIIKSGSIEQGLLGMAFHPNYPADRRVFFFHSKKDNDNVLVSYVVSADGLSIDMKSRVELITIDKEPDSVRHNAGALRFAPNGLLYVSVGDAARASKNGQNPKTLPGSILRLDVTALDRYTIPVGNPFADGKNGRPEVWWFGLRNPWRFSIDAVSGLAYIGDVGQETYEEVNVIPFDKPGLNFGWPIFEGTKRYSKGEPASAVTPPVVEIKHGGETGSCSITGGEVYRGAALPELIGHYFYADWCLGWIRSFRWDGSVATDKKDWSSQLDAQMVSAFGHDANGELLVVDYEAGTVSRLAGIR